MSRTQGILVVLMSALLATTAFAIPGPRSKKSSSSSSSSLSGPTTSCCFCVYPNPGERDSEKFRDMCEACLPHIYPNCGFRAAVAQRDLSQVAAVARCAKPIQLTNLQHGPDLSQVKQIVEVCRSLYPGCHLKINDLSCSTYESDAEAQAFIKTLQDDYEDGVIVDICGSGSVNMYAGCSFFRITKRYVVAPGFTKEKLGLCPAFGAACQHSQDGGKPFECLDTLGRKFLKQCCPMQQADLGYWGDWPRCGGRGCDERKCPSFQTCRDGEWKKQECTRDGVCWKHSFKCEELNQVCGMGSTGEECVKRASPIPSLRLP